MTDIRERAEKLCCILGLTEKHIQGGALDEILIALESEAALARKEEREACAAIAEAEHGLGTNGIGIATAIRRGDKTAIHERNLADKTGG